MNARTVTRLDVYKGLARAGELRRTERGAVFEYAPDYVSAHRGDALAAVAFTLPVRAEAYEVHGVNVHPFFAGLLPEGLRLKALVRAVKTSEDDLFSLLVASGSDTVGDVSVAPVGEAPRERAPVADLPRLGEASFRELLAKSLQYGDGGGDVSFAGVQPKVSAAVISFPVRAGDEGNAYILKMAPPEYPRLVENEAFFMNVARAAGIDVAPTRVVHDREGVAALLVERFDRLAAKDRAPTRVHQEDACQVLDRYPADKYRLTLADVSRALDVCAAPVVERLKLLRQQALAYLIVNGDLHARNVSVRVTGGRVELTPGYDILSTLPYGDRRLALAMEGRDDHVKAAHFAAFGERVGVRRAAVEGMLASLCARVAPWVDRLAEVGLEARQTRHLARVMTERLKELGG